MTGTDDWSAITGAIAAAVERDPHRMVPACPPRHGKTTYMAAVEAHRRIMTPTIEPIAPLLFGVSEMVDRINRRIASACAIPLRILDPVAWRAKRRAQRAARRTRRRRKATRGW